MANTEVVHNGNNSNHQQADLLDPDDPEYQRELRRPAVVKEDMKEMEARKRVTESLNSEEFRDELTEIVECQLSAAPLLSLARTSDLLAAGAGGVPCPINDLRGADAAGFARGERLLRCKLAALCRLLAVRGWSKGLTPLLTCRINQEQEHFLCAPHDLHCDEITAASLVTMDMQGSSLDERGAPNPLQFSVHAAVHAARPDLRCVLHLRAAQAVAVSSLRHGLLPVSQEAVLCGDVSTYDLRGPIADLDSRDMLTRNLGPTNQVLLLRHRGMLVCGRSVEEVWYLTSNLMQACEIQLHAIPSGLEALMHVPEEVRQSMREQDDALRTSSVLFEAEMRQLDSAGLRTGYIYRQPGSRRTPRASTSELRVPATASSRSTGDLRPREPRSSSAHRQQKRQHWMLTPNTYRRRNMQQTGTEKPDNVVRWVSEDELSTGARSEPVSKTTNPNQFAPQGDNPRELRDTQRKVRQHYYADTVDAGPQSRMLNAEGWDTAHKLQDTSRATESAVVLVGAASKGIISKDHQLNSQLYGTRLAHNPFSNVNDSDLQQYTENVQAGSSVHSYPDRVFTPPVVEAAASTTIETEPVIDRNSSLNVSASPAVTVQPSDVTVSTGATIRANDVDVSSASTVVSGPRSPEARSAPHVHSSRSTNMEELLSETAHPPPRTGPVPRPRSHVSQTDLSAPLSEPPSPDARQEVQRAAYSSPVASRREAKEAPSSRSR